MKGGLAGLPALVQSAHIGLSPAPACVRRGAVRRCPSRIGQWGCTTEMWGRSVACGNYLVRILSTQSALVLGLLHGPFLRGATGVCVALILCINQSSVSLGWFLGHGQVISNDQVDDDFALALELGGFGHEKLALIQCGLDLVTDRNQSLERYLR